MGIFDQMNKPGTSGRPGYFDRGDFDLTVTAIRSKESEDKNKPRGTHVVVAEFLVASSTNPGIRAGETRVWIASIEPNDKGDRAIADVKCLLFAIHGVDPQNAAAVADFEANLAAQNVTPEMLFKHATGEANPLAGKRLRLSCTIKPKRDKTPFTVHTWSPAIAPVVGG